MGNLFDNPSFALRSACLHCGSLTGEIRPKNGQDCVFCDNCNAFQYNAPRTETGRKEPVVSDKSYKCVYVVTERNGKSFWRQIGVAFVNRDSSLTVKLDALPVGGELQIRDKREQEPRTPGATDEIPWG